MLVTTRRLNCFNEWVEAGQPVPDPKRWHPCTLQSHLNLGWIRETESKAETPRKPRPRPNPPINPRPLQAARGTEFSCSGCGKGFKSAQGLRSHKGRAHPKA